MKERLFEIIEDIDNLAIKIYFIYSGNTITTPGQNKKLSKANLFINKAKALIDNVRSEYQNKP